MAINLDSIRAELTNRVGGRLLSLLVHTVVASDRSVGGLGFDRLSVRAHEDRRHQTERSVT